MCGKAPPFREYLIFFLSSFLRGAASKEREKITGRAGKAKPYRTSGGRAALERNLQQLISS
jgi:hypothetical protein